MFYEEGSRTYRILQSEKKIFINVFSVYVTTVSVNQNLQRRRGQWKLIGIWMDIWVHSCGLIYGITAAFASKD